MSDLDRRDLLKTIGVLTAATAIGTPSIGKALVSQPPGVGDRYPNRVVRYPPPCLESAGGPVINIKNPPYNAKGDGFTDDTAAFIAAYNHVLAVYDAGGWTGAGANNRFSAARIIYIPNGTYLVSDTIVYTGTRTDGDVERTGHMKFHGESRAGSIIKLKNNAAGFQSPSSPRSVLSLAKQNFNNRVSLNQVRDLTIDCGAGNPGAIGINWAGANHCEMRNITVRGGGVAGIRVRQAPTHSYSRDITVEGFRHGLLLDAWARATHVTWEFVTLRGQTISGIEMTLSTSATFRKVFSDNAVPVARINHRDSHLVMLDSNLAGGAAGETAIRGTTGQFFVRNCDVAGYGSGIIKGTTVVHPAGHITEYVSGPIFKHSTSTRTRSLSLPIQDPPELPYAPVSDWTRPEDFGGTGNAAVQAALNSGRSTIYLPHQNYSVGTVRVPATVKRIVFMGRGEGGTWRVNQASSTPVIFEDWGSGVQIFADAARIVEQNCMHFTRQLRGSTSGPLTFFASNGQGLPDNFGSAANVTRYCRAIDQQYAALPFLCQGGTTVVLGFKSEGSVETTSWTISSGAQVEILGGTQGVNPPATVLSINNSTVAAIMNSSGFDEPSSQVYVRDVRGPTTTITKGQLPARTSQNYTGGTSSNCFLPLYLTA